MNDGNVTFYIAHFLDWNVDIIRATIVAHIVSFLVSS